MCFNVYLLALSLSFCVYVCVCVGTSHHQDVDFAIWQCNKNEMPQNWNRYAHLIYLTAVQFIHLYPPPCMWVCTGCNRNHIDSDGKQRASKRKHWRAIPYTETKIETTKSVSFKRSQKLDDSRLQFKMTGISQRARTHIRLPDLFCFCFLSFFRWASNKREYALTITIIIRIAFSADYQIKYICVCCQTKSI